MTGLLIGLVAGGVLGAAAHALALKLRRITPTADARVLTDDDREYVADFEAHYVDVWQQVANFADRIAGDDSLLRERLRMFEQGDRS